MLQAIRDRSKGVLGIAIVVLLAIPFAFFGIQNYFFGQVDDAVAVVNDTEISVSDFNTEFSRERNAMRARFGDSLDASYFDQPVIRRQILDNMIRDEVVMQASERAGLTVPPERLRQEIGEIEVFQVDGRFDTDVYRSILRQQGMTPASFQNEVRKDLLLRQLPAAMNESSVALSGEVAAMLRLQNQTRSFDYLTVSTADFLDAAEVSEEAIVQHYEDNQDRYLEPEKVTIEYVELDAEFLAPAAQPDELMLRELYDEQRLRFVLPERRLTSHILISVPENADADTLRDAQEKAAAVAERVRAGEDFAEVAKEASDDSGSSELGGDLGWVERDIMVSAFEDALFSMETGEISDPVNTSFGFHVIWLREVEESRGKTFEEARFELAQDFISAEAEREFLRQQDQLLDLTFEDQGTLAPAAEALDLEIQTEGPFSRAGGDGIAADPAVIEAAFSEEVLVEGVTSDVITLGPNRVVFLRVLEHVEASPKDLESVRDEIVNELKTQGAREMAKAEAQAVLASVQQGTPLSELAEARSKTVSVATDMRRSSPGHDLQLVREVFKLHRPDAFPAWHMVEHSGDQYSVVALTDVADSDPSEFNEAQNEALSARIAQTYAQAEMVAMTDWMRANAEIRVAEDKIQQTRP